MNRGVSFPGAEQGKSGPIDGHCRIAIAFG